MNAAPWNALLAAFGICLASCSAPLVQVPQSAPAKSDPVSDQVHVRVNQYRASRGKQALIRHQGLDRLAADHSRFLLQNSGSFSLHGKKVSHYGFENRALAARRLYSMNAVGENVAAGTPGKADTGNYLLTLWKNSKDHHTQLLEDWTYTGIGSATGPDGTVYCTQLFASPNLSNLQTRDRFVPH